MSYDYFLDCIDKLHRLDKNSYDALIKKFKKFTNVYFDRYIDSLDQDEYLKNMSKFEYYLNINTFHTTINEKYMDPNITAYYNDVSKLPILSSEEEILILNKIYKLKNIIKKRKINDEYLNNLVNCCGYNKAIKNDLLSRKMQLKFLKNIKNKDLNKSIKQFELYVYYIGLKENFINCNLRLVLSFLKRKNVKSCDILDYIQWGNEGLLYAVDMYEPKYNTKFSTYAYFWINCKINAGLFREKRGIKSSYGMYLLSRQYNSFIKKYYSDYGVYPTHLEKLDFIYKKLYANKGEDKEICREKCIEKLNYIETMLKYENYVSLDIQIGEDLDNSIVDIIADPQTNVEKEATDFELRDIFKYVFSSILNISNKQLCIILLRNGIGIYKYLSFQDLQSVFDKLSYDKQKEIWKSHRIYTLQEIGNLLNISRQAINVQEIKIKKQIKKYKYMFDDYLD